MKKEYRQPQIIKYDSLRETTLADTKLDPACVENPGDGCSGSCVTQGWKGFKRSDENCP